jgi:hypothetical protein
MNSSCSYHTTARGGNQSKKEHDRELLLEPRRAAGTLSGRRRRSAQWRIPYILPSIEKKNMDAGIIMMPSAPDGH